MENVIIEKYKDRLINGREISEFIKFELHQKIKKEKITKNLAAILIGNNENSKTYLGLKKKFANFINVGFSEYIIDESEEENKILDAINFLNNDDQTNGIIIQLPIPKKFNENKILDLISKEKDVDGFLENTKFDPVLGKVIFKILQEYDDNILDKKNITIICNSDIFSKKIEHYLKSKLNADINKIVFNENNISNIKEKTIKSDIIISAVGKKHFIDHTFIKEGSIIIDIGITKEGGEIYGDVDIKDVIEKVKYITPPIGGVGPMTVAMLFDNLING